MLNNNTSTEIDMIRINNISIDMCEEIECCICLNTFDYEFIITNCCKKYIHKICLMDWILSDFNINIKCSMCRIKLKNLKQMISYEEFKTYIYTIIQKEYSKSNLERLFLINLQNKHKKFIGIINELYDYNNRGFDIISIFCKTSLISIYLFFLIFLILINEKYLK
jgi:hypothetical protein